MSQIHFKLGEKYKAMSRVKNWANTVRKDPIRVGSRDQLCLSALTPPAAKPARGGVSHGMSWNVMRTSPATLS